MSRGVDTSVYALAETFVDDIIGNSGKRLMKAQRDAFVQRVAEAAQQAIEDECQDIEKELA